MQETLNEGRLKFANKAKAPMQVDSDPLYIKEENYVEPLKCLMVETTKIPNIIMEVFVSEYAEKVKEVYPRAEEELIDFLNR